IPSATVSRMLTIRTRATHFSIPVACRRRSPAPRRATSSGAWLRCRSPLERGSSCTAMSGVSCCRNAEAHASRPYRYLTGNDGNAIFLGLSSHFATHRGHNNPSPRESFAMLNQPDGIDRSLLLAQLIATERHISATARNVLRQQSIIQELRRRGDDTSYARSL